MTTRTVAREPQRFKHVTSPEPLRFTWALDRRARVEKAAVTRSGGRCNGGPATCSLTRQTNFEVEVGDSARAASLQGPTLAVCYNQDKCEEARRVNLGGGGLYFTRTSART